MTREQLTDLRDAIDAHLAGKPVQWSGQDGVWFDNLTTYPDFTHNFHWRPKPESKTRLWSKPEDVPLPICWLRNPHWEAGALNALILSVGDRGFEYHTNVVRFVSWYEREKIEQLEYSTDGKNFLPCTVTES